MGAGTLTHGATMNEAELEAGLSHTLRHAFPWIHEGEIRHQLRFTVKLGNQTIEVSLSPSKPRAPAERRARQYGRAIYLVYGVDPQTALELVTASAEQEEHLDVFELWVHPAAEESAGRIG